MRLNCQEPWPGGTLGATTALEIKWQGTNAPKNGKIIGVKSGTALLELAFGVLCQRKSLKLFKLLFWQFGKMGNDIIGADGRLAP